MKTLLINKFYILSFVLIAILVYFPTFFNGFVWDDNNFIVNNTQIHSFNLTIFFDNIYNSGIVYRQFMPFYIAMVYTFFGGSPFVFHLLQLLFHSIVTVLLFLLFKKYFQITIAYILSLFFLIHPINAEAVLWISAVQIPALHILGLSALHIVHKKNLSEKNILLLGMLLFLCILSYEVSIYYFILVLFYLYYHKSKHFKKIAFLSIGIILLYLMVRYLNSTYFILRLYSNVNETATLAQHLATIPSIILYYFKMLIYPKDLMIWQSWYVKDITFWTAILPALIIQIAIIFLIWSTRYISKKNKFAFYFFLLWLTLGMSVLLHIIPLDMTVADRWFYFPFMGLLGIIGIFLQSFSKKIHNYKKILIIVLLLLICLYATRTTIRSFDWKNDFTLFHHDIKMQPNNYDVNYNLQHEYTKRRDCKNALIYLEKLNSLNAEYHDILYKTGRCYYETGQYEKARDTLLKAIDAYDNPHVAKIPENHVFLIKSYLKLKQYKEVLSVATDDLIEKSEFRFTLLLDRTKAKLALGETKNIEKDIEILKMYEMNKELEEVIQLYNKEK